MTSLSAFVARPEFSPHGFYVELDGGGRARTNRRWAFIPSPLPLPSAGSLLAALLEPANLSLRAAMTATESAADNLDAQTKRLWLDISASARRVCFRPGSMERWLCELQDVLAAGGGITHPERGLRTTVTIVGLRGSATKDLFLASPPVARIRGLLDALSDFIALDDATPPLLKAVFVHYQLISIQPFENGNARIAALVLERLLVEYGLVGDLILPVRLGALGHMAQVWDPLYRALRWGHWFDYVAFMAGVIERAALIGWTDRLNPIGAEASSAGLAVEAGGAG